jgi:hypothetical protein
MSDTVKAVLIDGKPIGYFPPTSAENVTYEEGVSVKDALDHVSNIYATEIKETGTVGAVTFNIPSIPGKGYIAIIGDGNPTPIFVLIPIHGYTVRIDQITNLTSASVTATFSNGVLTITGGSYCGIQAIASFPIS